MWARLSRFAGLPPERIDQAIQEFEREHIPAFEQLHGFEGVAVMVDRGSGKAAAITYWATQDDMRVSDKLADQARARAMQTAQPEREPIVDHYEVVVQKSPAQAPSA